MFPLHQVFANLDLSSASLALQVDNAAGHGDQPLPRHSGRSGVRRSYSLDDSFPSSPMASPRRRLVRRSSATSATSPSSSSSSRPKKPALDRWASCSPICNRWAPIEPTSPKKKTSRSHSVSGGGSGDCPPVLPGQGLGELNHKLLLDSPTQKSCGDHKSYHTNARPPIRRLLSTLEINTSSSPRTI